MGSGLKLLIAAALFLGVALNAERPRHGEGETPVGNGQPSASRPPAVPKDSKPRLSDTREKEIEKLIEELAATIGSAEALGKATGNQPIKIEIDALKKLKAHLELKVQGKKVPAGFWNVFDETSKLSAADEKGLEEVATMLNYYASELLKLQKEPLAAVDKATLDLIPKFIEQLNAKVSDENKIVRTPEENKFTVAAVRTIEKFRTELKQQNDPNPTDYSEDIYKVRNDIAGILEDEWKKGRKKIPFKDTYTWHLTSQATIEMMFNRILTLSKDE
jgi:hypothetical protein